MHITYYDPGEMSKELERNGARERDLLVSYTNAN